MAKGGRGRRSLVSRQCRRAPYPLPSYDEAALERLCSKKSLVLEKKNWDDITCSVCMEFPHNAVLLLCSSHGKGCRPYMCGTSYRHSNCLDQYKKANTKLIPMRHGEEPLHGLFEHPHVAFNPTFQSEKEELAELACPLCRGQVKGCTVVEPARDFLNGKKRSCMQENCSFVGNYKELRKHVKAIHPCARPREVDPAVEQNWQRLESERERQDVISTITASMPGARFFGDYVIENNGYEDSDEDEGGGDLFDSLPSLGRGNDSGFDHRGLANVFFLLHAFGPAGSVGSYRRQSVVRAEYGRGAGLQEGGLGEGGPTVISSRNSTGAFFDHGGDYDISFSDVEENTEITLGGLHHQREPVGRSDQERPRHREVNEN